MKHVINGLGSLTLFLVSLGSAWLTVKMAGIDWDRALLFQILWICALNRWHQGESKK